MLNERDKSVLKKQKSKVIITLLLGGIRESYISSISIKNGLYTPIIVLIVLPILQAFLSLY